MKKLLLATTSMIALGLASGAWAANVSNVNQSGSTNTSDVSQDGTQIQLKPYVGYGGSPTPAPASGTGSNGNASVTQGGTGGYVGVVQTDVGGQNNATVTQTNSTNDNARTIQNNSASGGNTNAVYVQQLNSATDFASSIQNGYNNTIVQNQGSSTAAVANSTSYTTQVGSGNIGGSTQTGTGHSSYIGQSALGNYADVTQSGALDKSSITQGSGHDAAVVVQNGYGAGNAGHFDNAESSIIQGSYASATVIQNGTAISGVEQHGIGGIATVYQQSGTGVNSTVLQTASATNAVAGVSQIGDALLSTVDQATPSAFASVVQTGMGNVSTIHQ